jgi:hypothetical protein
VSAKSAFEEGAEALESEGHMSCTFPRKGYGRIFTDEKENISEIKAIIKEMDEFEYDYLPDNFICVFNPAKIETVYTHKFDSLDTNELTKRCWEKGIMMFCWFGER